MDKVISLATNLGRGGISVLVLTGEASALQESDTALSTVSRRGRPLTPGELAYGIIHDRDNGEIIDEVVIAAFSDECRIITGHGGSTCALALLDFYTALGFTRTSDITPADADADSTSKLLNSLLAQTRTETQAKYCLRALRDLHTSSTTDITKVLDIMRPRVLALAGAPNTGKSSLLNRLCGYERVLVSEIAGTTLDAVRDYIDIGGYYTHIIDTAGFRDTTGSLENEAIRRGNKVLQQADTILLVFDQSRDLTPDDAQAITAALDSGCSCIITLLNKTDLPQNPAGFSIPAEYNLPEPLPISCSTASGIDRLISRITASFRTED